MKKNIILTVIFFFLVGVGWLIDSGTLTTSEESTEAQSLFKINKSDFVSFKLPKSKIVASELGPMVEVLNSPVDPVAFDKLFKNLNSLVVVKELVDSKNSEEFFTHQSLMVELETKKGQLKFRLGDVSGLTGSFYLQTFEGGNEKLFVVKNNSVLNGYYKSKLEADLKKYLELKDLLSATAFELIDKRLLSSLDISRVQKIKVDNRRNRWFEIDLEQGGTTPAPPKSVSFDFSKEKIYELLLGIKFKKFEALRNSVLEDSLSTVDIKINDEVLTLKLYGLLNNEKGLFVSKSDRPETVFTLSDGQDFFFDNVQSFWDKKLILPTEKILNLEKLNFKLGLNLRQMVDFYAYDIQNSFKISPKDQKVTIQDLSYFNLLFNMVFANGVFNQADMVNKLDAKELQQIQSNKKALKLEFLDKSLLFLKENDTLTMIDIINGVEFKYLGNVGLKDFREDLFFAFK